MGYKVDKLRFSKFYRYILKRYNFLHLVSSQGDLIQDSDVSIESIFVSVFICLILRWGSFRRIERELTRGRLQKFIPQKERLTFCQNTIGYGLEHISTEIQEEQLAFVVKKLKRNKAYNDITTHYGFARLLREPLHRAVIAQKVGCSLKPMMQEATDAWRIRWAYGRLKRFCPKIKETITLRDTKVNLLQPSV